MPMLDDAIQAIQTGRKEEGRRLLEEILEVEENNEQVWLWLTSVVDTDEDREVCLENVLALDPDSVIAKKGLEALRMGTFNVHAILNEALEAQEEMTSEPVEPAINFRDEFFQTPEAELDDDELVMPSAMAGAKPKKAGKGGPKINVRIIILLALVLVIVLVLGGLAASRLLLGGGDEGPVATPVEEQPGQVAPVEGSEPTPTDTGTPSATPTDTPTPTTTPDLSLPTRRPTDAPSPTATMVVPATPG